MTIREQVLKLLKTRYCSEFYLISKCKSSSAGRRFREIRAEIKEGTIKYMKLLERDRIKKTIKKDGWKPDYMITTTTHYKEWKIA
jgi:hypothetical protein